jgi:hypothetical protein
MWVVFARSGDERVVARARRQATAWTEAVRLALGTNGAAAYVNSLCTAESKA